MVANVPDAWIDERWLRNVAYPADRRLFAAGCEDGNKWFWEARSGKVAREWAT